MQVVHGTLIHQGEINPLSYQKRWKLLSPCNRDKRFQIIVFQPDGFIAATDHTNSCLAGIRFGFGGKEPVPFLQGDRVRANGGLVQFLGCPDGIVAVHQVAFQ